MLAPKTAKPPTGASQGPEHGVSRGPTERPAPSSGAVSWDFGKIALSVSERTSRDRSSSRRTAPRRVQPKLSIGAVNDPLEHEADTLADRVMRMPDPGQGRAAVVQRKCATCEDGKDQTIRTKRTQAAEPENAEAPAAVDELLQSSGRPLDSGSRAFFEPRFGHDFSRIRVHTGELAARSAQSIGALAFAAGPHIAFAAGQYAPGSDHGRHLLAHELVHTIQQGHSHVRRQPAAIRQGFAGLVDKPEKFGDDEASAPVTVAGTGKEAIQRSATWKGASVHETINNADFDHDPITWHLLNGTKLTDPANADAAIKVPAVTTTGTGTDWTAKVDSVPAQEGGADESVLSPGPWTLVITKAKAGSNTQLPACSGAGNSTFTAHGKPSDDSVYKANRRHEDHHVADHKVAFDDAIGKWDKKVQDAKDKGSAFKGGTAAAAIAALWTAMGNTPQNAARSYRSLGLSKGGDFHATPAGKAMVVSNPVCNADCSTSAVDITNPMP
jgi:hypothetical protein